MGFLGPVSQVGGHLVRPHDLMLSGEPVDGAEEAMVDARALPRLRGARRARRCAAASEVTAQVTRAEADELELADGDIVWVRAPGGTEQPRAAYALPRDPGLGVVGQRVDLVRQLARRRGRRP